MALTRKMLKGMGLSDEQIDTIIEAHSETVEGLKQKAAQYEEDAKMLPAVRKELDDLKADNGESYKAKYEAEAEAHKAYREEVENARKAAKDDADVLDVCKAAGVTREAALRLVANDFDRSRIKRGEDGGIVNRDELTKYVKETYADFVATTENKGTPPATPPSGGNGMTREQIMAIKDPAAQRVAIAQNMELFTK